ncbi:MAG: hypothetical protein HFJ06_01885 [Lachnospiraceae bacterium]|nr:hypothetical protein [Lachnospiraceae bacterium]
MERKKNLKEEIKKAITSYYTNNKSNKKDTNYNLSEQIIAIGIAYGLISEIIKSIAIEKCTAILDQNLSINDTVDQVYILLNNNQHLIIEKAVDEAINQAYAQDNIYEPVDEWDMEF